MNDGAGAPNPYASPDVEVPQAPEVKKKFRWRVIPVTFLYVMGAPGLVAWVFIFGAMVWWRLNNPDSVGIGPNGPMLVGCLFGVIASGLCLLTAYRLQRGRWWSAGMTFCVVAILFFVCGRFADME